MGRGRKARVGGAGHSDLKGGAGAELQMVDEVWANSSQGKRRHWAGRGGPWKAGFGSGVSGSYK